MKKLFLTLLLTCITTTTASFAEDSAHEQKAHGKQKKHTVEVQDLGEVFQLDITSNREHPTASELELKALLVVAPRENKPGHLRLRLKPTKEPKAQVSGPHHGLFIFQKANEEAQIANMITDGKYHLVINGRHHGFLIIGEEGALLQTTWQSSNEE